jgi:hypothetical protein
VAWVRFVVELARVGRVGNGEADSGAAVNGADGCAAVVFADVFV